jgi:hypothetical protein
MSRRRPPCDNWQAHAPHGRPVPGETFLEVCPGWCQRDADVTALADRLDQIARESLWPMRLPAGIRMECHPSVVGPLRDLNDDEFAPSLSTGENALKPQIHVVVMAAMAAGQWLITADDGLIAEGVVRGG